jgi:hypothetical protein
MRSIVDITIVDITTDMSCWDRDMSTNRCYYAVRTNFKQRFKSCLQILPLSDIRPTSLRNQVLSLVRDN